ncbi:MAG: hypothetical protein QXD59_02225 [Candidatus Caldarchaeum sp.]
MKPFHLVIPPHVAEIRRSLHPDLKQSIKAAIRAIAAILLVANHSAKNWKGSGSIAFNDLGSSMPPIIKLTPFASWPSVTGGRSTKN